MELMGGGDEDRQEKSPNRAGPGGDGLSAQFRPNMLQYGT